jgi:hypothetical protein
MRRKRRDLTEIEGPLLKVPVGLPFLFVNARGEAWGGCHRTDGLWLPGCFWP